ncbi:hypothetical protein JL101_010575 [Skermanella rosea]|uniref:Uncharacterized protein n=1 Tax=Skermanella cutis TaxID=2775420 RepID=A0ABX7BCN2_9PROT|nr:MULTISPECIES: hypothetical protein [Skermanella]QQP92141.1 hypothetical protein IGS68_13465 [Skermanella sp. TT6]UEM05846.1 hypothetical protein JL101_010575 [Skermanella rosea]
MRRRKAPVDVIEGSVFRRTTPGKIVETARVLAVSKDSVGIPHVRFSVHYERVDTADELRTLALSSFSELFSERVLA